MRFRFAPRSMTLDDLELLEVQIVLEFCATSHFWEATTAKLNKWNPLSAMELLRTESTFQRCIAYVDIAGRSSTRQSGHHDLT